MLRQYQADLHVHTCLSPCADDDMKPHAIVNQAKKKGLDIVAICDHNSTKNVEAVQLAAKQEDLTVIGGMEVCSQEEVHILGLFDGPESLKQMQTIIDKNLTGENNPEFFGDQHLCDEHDEIVGREMKLLIGAVKLTVEQIVDSIHSLGGLAIASHVDREYFSIYSQLGFIPEGLPLDALEISQLHSKAEIKKKFPQTENFVLVSSSDAHQLDNIGSVSTKFTGKSPSFEEFRKALFSKQGRQILN